MDVQTNLFLLELRGYSKSDRQHLHHDEERERQRATHYRVILKVLCLYIRNKEWEKEGSNSIGEVTENTYFYFT